MNKNENSKLPFYAFLSEHNSLFKMASLLQKLASVLNNLAGIFEAQADFKQKVNDLKE